MPTDDRGVRAIPTDQSGNYSLPQIYLAQPGTTILAEQHNQPLQDIAQAMSQRLMRDGRNGMVGNLDLGSFRIINVGDGINESDAVNVGQAGDVVAASTEGAPVKNTPVDADSLPLSDSENDNTLKKLTWARVKAVLATVLVPQTRTVTGGGLATGGGALTENRTITVTAASKAQMEAGTATNVVATALGVKQAMDGRPYSGSNPNNEEYPIGTGLPVVGAGIANSPIGAALNVWVRSDELTFTATSGDSNGTQLNGTWRKYGNIATNAVWAVRVPS